MELIIESINVFEEKCIIQFEELVRQNFCGYKKEVPYQVDIYFHVNSLREEEKWRAINKTKQSQETKRIKPEDTVQEAMSYQLEGFVDILKGQGFEITNSRIIGDHLSREDIIKVQFNEDMSQAFYSGRGKNKKRIKTSVIVPNLSGTNSIIAEYMSDKLSNIFYDFLKIIKDEYLLSEILGIEHTRNLDKLFSAFASKYRNLAWPFDNDRGTLLEELTNKAMEVFKRNGLLDTETKVDLK